MSLVITGTFGLCVWIVLWALNVSGFDALLIAIVLVLIVSALRNVVPLLFEPERPVMAVSHPRARDRGRRVPGCAGHRRLQPKGSSSSSSSTVVGNTLADLPQRSGRASRTIRWRRTSSTPSGWPSTTHVGEVKDYRVSWS